MPWQGSDLWVAELDAAGRPARPRHVAGGERESIFQPHGRPPASCISRATAAAGGTCIASAPAGSSRCIRWRPSSASRSGSSASRCTASPADGSIVCLYEQGGRSHLGRIDAGGRLREIATPYCSLRQLAVERPRLRRLLAASETRGRGARALRSRERDRSPSCAAPASASTTPADLAIAEPIEFPTEGGATAHAFFYAPRNAGFVGEPGRGRRSS
jgi:hypothetical protein